MYALYSLLNVKPPQNPLLHGHTVQVGCHGLMILVILSPCSSVRGPSRCHLFLFVFNLPVVETIQGLHPHGIHKDGKPPLDPFVPSNPHPFEAWDHDSFSRFWDLHELGCSTDFPLDDWQKRSDSSANVRRDCASPSRPHQAPHSPT